MHLNDFDLRAVRVRDRWCRHRGRSTSNFPKTLCAAVLGLLVLASPFSGRGQSARSCAVLFGADGRGYRSFRDLRDSESLEVREGYVRAAKNLEKFQKLVERYNEFIPVLERHDNDQKLTRLNVEEALYVHKAGGLSELTLPEAERRYAWALAREVRDRRFAVAEEFVELFLKQDRLDLEPWKKKWLARAFLALNRFPRVTTPPKPEEPMGKMRLFSRDQIEALSRVIELEVVKNNPAMPMADGVVPAVRLPEQITTWNRDEDLRREQIRLLWSREEADQHLSAIREFFALPDSAKKEAEIKCCGALPTACSHCIKGISFAQRNALRHALVKPDLRSLAEKRLASKDQLEEKDKLVLKKLLADQMTNEDWMQLLKVPGLSVPGPIKNGLVLPPLFDISSRALQDLRETLTRERDLDLGQAPPHLLLNELSSFKKKDKKAQPTGDASDD